MLWSELRVGDVVFSHNTWVAITVEIDANNYIRVFGYNLGGASPESTFLMTVWPYGGISARVLRGKLMLNDINHD